MYELWLFYPESAAGIHEPSNSSVISHTRDNLNYISFGTPSKLVAIPEHARFGNCLCMCMLSPDRVGNCNMLNRPLWVIQFASGFQIMVCRIKPYQLTFQALQNSNFSPRRISLLADERRHCTWWMVVSDIDQTLLVFIRQLLCACWKWLVVGSGGCCLGKEQAREFSIFHWGTSQVVYISFIISYSFYGYWSWYLKY